MVSIPIEEGGAYAPYTQQNRQNPTLGDAIRSFRIRGGVLGYIGRTPIGNRLQRLIENKSKPSITHDTEALNRIWARRRLERSEANMGYAFSSPDKTLQTAHSPSPQREVTQLSQIHETTITNAFNKFYERVSCFANLANSGSILVKTNTDETSAEGITNITLEGADGYKGIFKPFATISLGQREITLGNGKMQLKISPDGNPPVVLEIFGNYSSPTRAKLFIEPYQLSRLIPVLPGDDNHIYHKSIVDHALDLLNKTYEANTSEIALRILIDRMQRLTNKIIDTNVLSVMLTPTPNYPNLLSVANT